MKQTVTITKETTATSKKISWKKENNWIQEYVDNLPDETIFEIKTLRYLDKKNPTSIAKTFRIPLAVVMQILKQEYDLEKEEDI